MPQVLKCPSCTKPVQIPDGAAGKQLKCPSCQKPFTVPKPAGAPAPGAAKVPVGAGVAAAGASSAPVNPSSASIGDFALPSIPQQSSGGATKCPACQSDLLPGAISCMDCGYMIQQEPADAGGGGDAPAICTNPACGVANAPGERNCARCGNVLPTAPGTMINNRYRIEKQLAVGGFGAVYKATDTKTSGRGRHQGHDLRRPRRVRHPPELLPPRGRNPPDRSSPSPSSRACST